MRKTTASILLILCMSGALLAQKAAVKGIISDTTERKPLASAVIAVLRQSDSVMQAWTRSSDQGRFTIGNIPPGDYLLLVTFPKFADYVEPFSLKADTLLQFSNVILTRKSQLLQEVIVTQKISAIRMKGDTLEFKADSFRVQPGATVEDLLKKLPGIQVNSKGEITAQGEKVQKVLVDGEEFFGDDPTLVTQNLRADMVDKVQVFDKKSDQAAFSGIDDGQRTKTINLKLKDDKKNGYFGKVSAGGGTGGYYDGQIMANYFRKKEKLAVYGIVSNTGKTGLNWNERDSYGQSFAGMVDYDENSGNFAFYGNNNDELDSWDGRYNGQGYPAVKTGGIHYGNKWDDDKQNVNGNYKAMQLSVTGDNNSNTINILPDTLYYSSQKQHFSNQILRNRADGGYELKIDSTSSLKITADGGSDHKITANAFTSDLLAGDSALVNRSSRTINTIGDIQTANSNIIWRKKLPKKGRTLSVSFNEKYQRDKSSGYLLARNDFYKNDTINQTQLTDQYKNYLSEKTQLNSKIAYTEPLSSVSFLGVNYGFGINNSSSNRNSYNKSADGKYNEPDLLYSNDYRFNVLTHSGGLNYTLIKKKIRFSAGSDIGLTHFDQTDVHADTSATRRFTNWYPRASFSYALTPQQRLSLQYSGYTTQPTIQQIQPTATNEDPLNITVGNPGLKPQFTSHFGLNYNDYKVIASRYIYANINYSTTQNFISTSSNTDSSGRRVSQSVNTNGNSSLNAYFDYDFKWRKTGIDIDFNGSTNQGRYVAIVNQVLNTTNSGSYTGGISLGKSKEKKFDAYLGASVTYTRSVSSVQASAASSYWTYFIHPQLHLFLPLKFELSADAEINLRPKSDLSPSSNNAALLNAWAGKKLLKTGQLMLKLSVNDLLNQNIGFSRTVNSNYISQNTYSTIQRFAMLSLTWNFNKTGTPAPTQQ